MALDADRIRERLGARCVDDDDFLDDYHVEILGEPAFDWIVAELRAGSLGPNETVRGLQLLSLLSRQFCVLRKGDLVDIALSLAQDRSAPLSVRSMAAHVAIMETHVAKGLGNASAAFRRPVEELDAQVMQAVRRAVELGLSQDTDQLARRFLTVDRRLLKIELIEVGERPVDLRVPSHSVTASARPARDGLADITIRVTGKEVAFDRFTDARTLDLDLKSKNPSVGGALQYAVWPGDNDHVLLLGTMAVVLLNAADGSVKEMFTRYRDEDDDHGFYRDELVKVEAGVLLVYEGGAAMITRSGDTAWHKPLTWNDLLIRLDGSAAHFSREEADGTDTEWWMDLRDGSEHKKS